MIQKKLALLGATGVGKTSLVRRFVESAFDDTYLTTIGVKVDKKRVRLADEDVTLMVWDIAGAEEQFSVPSAYVKGSHGLLIVADGTRPDTLAVAARLVAQMDRDLGPLPCVLALNKSDLIGDWRVDPSDYSGLDTRVLRVLPTSAKTGDGVEEAFQRLAAATLLG